MVALTIAELDIKYVNQVSIILLMMISSSLFVVNSENALLTRQDFKQSNNYQIAREIAACANEDQDIVIVSNYDYKPWVDVYTSATALPVDGVFWVVSLDNSEEQIATQAFGELQSVIRETGQNNTRIFIAEDVFQGGYHTEHANVSADDLKAFFSGYTLIPTQCSYQLSDTQKMRLYLLDR
jgi:hypothetical protein